MGKSLNFSVKHGHSLVISQRFDQLIEWLRALIKACINLGNQNMEHVPTFN